jgi:PrtD family type I secretion system ABC transporter
MPIRLECLSFEEARAALRELKPEDVAKRLDPRANAREPVVYLNREAQERSPSHVARALNVVKQQPLVQRVQAFFAGKLNAASEITSAVAGSEILGAAWRGIRQHIWLIVGFSAGINILYLAPSLYMMQVYDRVLPTGGILTLVLLSIILVACLAVMATLDILRGRLLARASLRVERLASVSIIRESLAARRNASQPGSHPGVRELDTLRAALSSPAMVGLLDLPWTPLFIFICFVINVWIGALAVAGVAIISALALVNERASRANLKEIAQRSPRFFAAHESDLNAAESIHALGAEPALTQRRLQARESLVDAQVASAFDNANYSALTKSVRMLLQSVALGVGCFLAVERQISPGAIIAVTILMARALAPVEQIVGGWRQLAFGYAALQELLRAQQQLTRDVERTPLPAPAGRIGVEQVSATTPDGRAPALQNVSFAAGPGEIIGIIGPSGAGKTSLARILANAAPPYSGVIRVDGARYSDWDQRALAAHIGYLPQRIDLFDGTITQNISCFAGSTGAPMEEVGRKAVQAAQLAGAHELILGLPNGYETQLGLNGGGISPGQAQRIALARALYDEPRIIVLDEPNSHLDSDGENALSAALVHMRAKGSVCFVVAHRAGVISTADKILVLKDGRVVDYGPRLDVLAKLSTPPQQLRPVRTPAAEQA